MIDELQERAELTDAVCRELASSSGEDFFDCDAPRALGRLRAWLVDRYGDFRHYGIGLLAGSDDGLVARVRAGSRACDGLAMLLTADSPSDVRGDAAAIRQALREWERVKFGEEEWADLDDGPAYAIHTPYRTTLVVPCGEPRHRSTFHLPGLRVHVISAADPQGFEALTEEIRRRACDAHWSFDPHNPTVESAFVRGLDDDAARELGRQFDQTFVARWDSAAWTDLSTDGTTEYERGWRYEPFAWDDYDVDALEIVQRTRHPAASSWTITGTPGAWTVHSRPGDGSGNRTTRSRRGRIVDVVAADPQLHALRRGTISQYTVHGSVEPEDLLAVLTSDATEGAEDPNDWPDDPDHLADRWSSSKGHTIVDLLPWVDRWASINDRQVSALWADGQSLVVFRDSPVEELRHQVDAVREDAAHNRT